MKNTTVPKLKSKFFNQQNTPFVQPQDDDGISRGAGWSTRLRWVREGMTWSGGYVCAAGPRGPPAFFALADDVATTRAAVICSGPRASSWPHE